MISPLSPLRAHYSERKKQIFDALQNTGRSTRSIRPLLRKLSRHTDLTLKAVFKYANLPNNIALIALGGFGRGELHPYSDVDVLLLLPDEMCLESKNKHPPADMALLKKNIEIFIGSCWDVGLEIGSSVRTSSQCLHESAKDVTIQTTLLEARIICGNRAVFEDLNQRFRAQIQPRTYLIAKTLELQQRHNKFENSPYTLEPNCKESPGGLRDLHVVLWVANAAGYGKNWDALARNGLASPFEVRQIKKNEALLNLIRARLHLFAKRREDRLTFELQSTVAKTFGDQTSTAEHSTRVVRDSEKLMRRYYWAAKAVTQLHQILLLNIEERLNANHLRFRINAHFFDKAGMIEVASDDLYLRHPHAILETFLLYQSQPGLRGLSARTLRALYNARSTIQSEFRKDPVNRAQFLRILQAPSGVTHALRLMNQTSILGRYLWSFRRIVGQMQHDLTHAYTVDQHTLMVVRNMRRFFMAEHVHEYPFCSQLASEWDKPWILIIAAFFHDIGKGRGGNHAEIGAHEVRLFCRQHGVNEADAKRIEFLVREHLSLSYTAQKSDISDPQVIAEFAKQMGNEQNLAGLYLLTVADIRGTSPKLWNAWKGKLLLEVYHSALQALGGHNSDPDTTLETRKRQAQTILALHGYSFDSLQALWNTLDIRYFMRHDAGDIAWHARQIFLTTAHQKPPPTTIVQARQSPLGEGLQVMVYSPDRSDLFMRICSYFDQAVFSILDAKIHTTSNGYALDTFQVITPLLPEHYDELIYKVEQNLHSVIAENRPLALPSQGRISRRVKNFPFPPKVELKADEKSQHWLLYISTSDRTGLLYAIAIVLAKYGLNLQLAKITTLGERVEDTFLISGDCLKNERTQLAIETQLLEACHIS